MFVAWFNLNSCVFKQQLGLYFIKFSESGFVLFILYYYEVIGDHKTTKSFISNAPGKALGTRLLRPRQRFEFKCPTPGTCFTGKYPGGMGTLEFD
jgi:hypothetical protein